MAKLHLFCCSLCACINEYAEKTSLILYKRARAQSLSLSLLLPLFFLKERALKIFLFFPFFSLFSWTLDIGGLLSVELSGWEVFEKKIHSCSDFAFKSALTTTRVPPQKQNIRTCYFAPLTMARLFRLPSSHRRRRRRGEEDNVRRNHFGRRQQ